MSIVVCYIWWDSSHHVCTIKTTTYVCLYCTYVYVNTSLHMLVLSKQQHMYIHMYVYTCAHEHVCTYICKYKSKCVWT